MTNISKQDGYYIIADKKGYLSWITEETADDLHEYIMHERHLAEVKACYPELNEQDQRYLVDLWEKSIRTSDDEEYRLNLAYEEFQEMEQTLMEEANGQQD